MHEIELKFQIPAASRDALARAVREAEAAAVVRLQARYVDTPERLLGRHGFALRLRHEGDGWVQTLKGRGDGMLRRLEHNAALPVGAADDVPALSLARHAGTPAGDALQALLAQAGQDAAALQLQFSTDITRTQVRLAAEGATIELALDEGVIRAGADETAVLPVHEIEFELLDGAAHGLLAQAYLWVEAFGLWLDVRSKAERGTLLALGRRSSPPRKAAAVSLQAALPSGEARRRVLGECVQQVLANASQIASGGFEDDHVHQLRVGLRRLRSALALFVPARDEAEPLAEGAGALFRALGAARDRAAVAGPMRAQLAEALRAQGLALAAPEWPTVDAPDPALLLRSPATQAWLLEALRSVLPAPEAAGQPVGPALAERLAVWHRKVKRDAGRFATLDDAARHRLRKRIKRLRYGLEFARGCVGAKKSTRLLAALAEAQAQLGALNDAGVALQVLRGAPAGDPSVAFAIGWLAARQEVLVAACGPALAKLAAARAPWKD